MAKKYVFQSCNDDITDITEIENLENKNLEQCLCKKYGSADVDFKCIKKQDNIQLAMDRLDAYAEYATYVIDTHKDFDDSTYWEIGYAMGKGLVVTGYYDDKSTKNISQEVEKLISPRISNNADFLEMVHNALKRKKSEEDPSKEDVNKLFAVTKRDPEAT